MRIRSAEPHDADAMVPLLEQLGYATDELSVRRRLKILLERDDCSVYVAEEGERVVGLASVQVLSLLHTDATRFMLTALVVAEEMRGRGLGRALVEWVESEAKRHGPVRVFLNSGSHRSEAHRFYEHLGYGFTGRRYAKDLP
jgi:GNAT superfamily N-acetyltransferase